MQAITFVDDVFVLFLEKWKRRLVGDKKLNSTDNKYVKQLIQSREKAAEQAFEKFLGFDHLSMKALFQDTDIITTGMMTQTYSYLRQMAIGYATYGSKYYKNETFKKVIRYGLNWMDKNYYHVDYTWKPIGKNNWWDWGMGVPGRIIDILILMREDFTSEEIAHYLHYFDLLYPKPVSTGSNWAHFCMQILCSGALQKNAERAMVGLNAFKNMYLYVEENPDSIESFLDEERASYTKLKRAGFYKDGSYVYHTLHPMNQTYGLAHFTSLCMMENVTAGTVFELKNVQRDNVASFFLNNLDTTVFDGTTVYRMFLGRATEKEPCYAGTKIHAAMLECVENYPSPIRDKIYSIIKGAYMQNPEGTWNKELTFEGAVKLGQIMEDDRIVPRVTRCMNKVFSNQDTVVHEQGKWSLGIQMSSSRTFNYESINNKNMDGWYLGDGRTEYFVKGLSQGRTVEYWSKVNKYRLPGTTVDTQERQCISVIQGNEYLSSKDFVGGVSLRGLYGVAAMELESYHADKPLDRNKDGKGANPVHQSDLTAKKGYFMFDNCVVCLGTDVKASNNNNAEVLTIVENKMADTVRGVLVVDGQKIKLSEEDHDLNSVTWANVANECGYYFFSDDVSGMSRTGDLKARKTNGSTSFFELWYSHGINPNNGSYAYALLPGMTAEETAQYASKFPVQVLANNSSVQAVYHEALDITGIIFWEAGAFGEIIVDKPCIVMYEDNPSGFRMAVSDPTQKLERLTVTVKEKLSMVEVDECVNVSLTTDRTIMAFSTLNSDGKTFELWAE